MDFDLLIKNGRIIDGTGNGWLRADLGISGGKIAELSRSPLKGAKQVIDAKGLIVCPGFMNLHSHSDSTILYHNNAENCVGMGLTTELVGSCGISAAPITEEYRKSVVERMRDRGFSLMHEEADWLTLDEWLRKLEKKGIGINIAPLVGHGTVRSCAMGVEGEGGERVEPAEGELRRMRAMVDRAMRDGAFGVSTGLIYPPGRNALTSEIIGLVKVAAKYGGVYSSHIRSEGDQLIESVQEFIDICEKAGVRGTISHHKASGRSNYGKVNETLRMVERARSRGVEIIVDQYPWTHGGVTKSLGARFKSSEPTEEPDIKTRQELLERLRDEGEWRKLKAADTERRAKEAEMYEKRRQMLSEKGGWTPRPYAIETAGTILYSRSHPELEGRSLEEVAEAFGTEDVLEGIRAILLVDEGWTCVGGEPYSEEDILTVLRYPWTTVSTDQYAMDNSKISLQAMADVLAMQHPRGWGTYPKILGQYVREERALTMEEAIRKMTSLPANFLGLQDRGLVREGFWADLVAFDPETVGNVATYGNPSLFPRGIQYVLVNGRLVIDKGKHTGELAGRALRYNR